MFRQVVIILNPTAGQPQPILHILGEAFKDRDIQWDVQIIKGGDDPTQFARDAVAAGVDAVMVYGGDGTVGSVAAGIVNSDVPLVILPGGTANVVAAELGIPADVSAALQLALQEQPATCTIDAGRANGQVFLLRASLGYEAEMAAQTDPAEKQRFGGLAYALSSLRIMHRLPVAHYQVRIDDETVEMDGIGIVIANSGKIGRHSPDISADIEIADGLLDVLLLEEVNIAKWLASAASSLGLGEPVLPHWKAQQIEVQVQPAQKLTLDGEVSETDRLTVEVLPQSLKVVVPTPTLAT